MTFPFAKEYPDTPYPGYWEGVTSTIDWCEENYVVTPYIAEAMNTISNAVFILLAIFAMQSAYRNNFEVRFVLISFGFMLVGVGSWLFHMTLKYEFQLLDELPMIYATCVPLWSIFSEGKSYGQSVAVGTAVAFGANLLTAVYLYFKDPTIHQVAYAIMNVLIVYVSYGLAQKYATNQKRKSDLFKVMVQGIVIFLSGYLLWNMDVHLCKSWISLRRNIGMPYGFFFELHAWWHILTGTGVYFYVVYLEYLRVMILGKEKDYVLVHHFFFLPELKLKSKPTSLVDAVDVKKSK